MSKVAVVILNYNGKKLLPKFLPSVIQYSAEARIVVADNNSTDGSVDFLQKEFSDVDLIQIATNLGFCGGYNYALRQIEADYYVLLNSDVEVTENWLAPMLHLLDTNPRLGAVQPKILSYNEKDSFEYAGAGGGFIDRYGYPFCRGRIFNTIEKDQQQYDDSIPIFWATGACMVVRASLFKELGGLDEDFFAHMEEIDFCWRLKRAGYEVRYQGKSTVYHVGGATLATSNPRKTYFNFRNGLALLIKNLSPSQLITRLPVRILLDWVAALQFLIRGKVGDFLAVVKAHGYILFHFSSLHRKRTIIRRQIPNYKVNQVYQGAIVFAYYLRGKKHVNELWANSPK